MDEETQRLTDMHTGLCIHETWCRDKQAFLLSKGYMLPRRHLYPGWHPSRLEDGDRPYECEDGVSTHVVNARRMSDGRWVSLKRVSTGGLEPTIAIMLSSEPLSQDPWNHSVPVLDLITDNENPTISYLVMPALLRPDFEYVADVVDFVDQILEGLVFLHDAGVAHGDCTMANLMMDATDSKKKKYHLLPTQGRSRYHFLGYTTSSYFPPGKAPGLVVGTRGRDPEVPELSDSDPYDPFAVDIFIIGNLLRKEFVEHYTNLDFLKPLSSLATRSKPASRPSAVELLNI